MSTISEISHIKTISTSLNISSLNSEICSKCQVQLATQTASGFQTSWLLWSSFESELGTIIVYNNFLFPQTNSQKQISAKILDWVQWLNNILFSFLSILYFLSVPLPTIFSASSSSILLYPNIWWFFFFRPRISKYMSGSISSISKQHTIIPLFWDHEQFISFLSLHFIGKIEESK